MFLYSIKCQKKINSGKYVYYDHFRVFGCKVFVHIPKDEKSKLDLETRQFGFVSYDMDEFEYKFYDSIGKKKIWSKIIIFGEDQTLKYADKI